ncbi:uncharacterized protein A1O9_09258 [Exophiala aquamarina CBS 119918]|uniref:Enoyl reductase (ER) domain-containing protein n=1 Tax=Exophiala aquamarina CBS 119918 TaxID=1182545 RepID=A0A072P4R9_9EURO|nr:uncharacterized protein A1O9_09258 [Exophiala aquamarina CBS 119918]KEF54816.1 hypothetical protein A1O9_09258 [Exophiala aquamarina CBS 119918]
MSTHAAIVTVGPGLPLEVHQVETPKPVGNQVRLRNEWTASTPLDLHQADGGFFVTSPQVLGDGHVGKVVEVGPEVSRLKIGDIVFGFGWRNQAEKAHQEFVVTNENLLAKMPVGFSPQEAVTLPNNFVTAWHTLTRELDLELPWPKPPNFQAKANGNWILIWGGSSSVGQYLLQILKYYGYQDVVATASKAHHERLSKYGARHCFDYRNEHVIDEIERFIHSQAGGAGQISLVVDCIGSQKASVMPVSKLAKAGSKVAIMLPVIIKDAAPGVKPEYTMDVNEGVSWADGVQRSGVRTHFYLENQHLADKLQSEIMPTLLEQRVIEPNDQVIVEGDTFLERAENALSKLRNKEVSGARLVWRVADA